MRIGRPGRLTNPTVPSVLRIGCMANQQFPHSQKYSILRWAGPHFLHSKKIFPTAKITEKRVAGRMGTGGYHGPDLPFREHSYPMQGCGPQISSLVLEPD